MRRRQVIQTACLIAAGALTGCGWFGGEEEQDFDEDLPALNSAIRAEAEETNEENAADANETPPSAPTQPSDEPPAGLAVGTTIPLKKTVTETLSQGSLESRSVLTLDIRISVEEILDGGRPRLKVQYERVRYSGNVAGENFEYDSANPPETVAPQALVYQGLAGNGFYVWIGRDGKPTLLGFDQFLRRCVEHLPRETRQSVLADVVMATDRERMSKFIDSTFGLLPPPEDEDELKTGTHWTAQHTVSGPVPMNLLNEYEIRKLSRGRAEIEIRGTVGATINDVQPAGFEGGMSVRARGGRTMGQCTVDLATGIPLDANVERFIDMEVRLPDGTRLEQHKRVVTTLESPRLKESAAPASGGD